MIQRSNSTLEQISIELAKLQQVVAALQTQEIPSGLGAHLLAASGVHGISGSVVGTTDTQDLSSKTMIKLLFGRSDLTIASGVITVTRAYHRVDTQAAAATDDLDTISGMVTGQVVILASISSSRDVTVKHGTGNLFLANNTDFILGNSRDHIMLICTGGEINELSRSKNS